MSTGHSSQSARARMGLVKPLLGFLLVTAAACAVVVGVVRESASSNASEAVVAPVEHPQAVTVYYFHGEIRCETCLAIESATERVVREEFADDLAAGALRYEAVNFDAPDGRHFRDDYDLAFGTVIVQGVGDARPWEDLDEVWSHIHDDDLAEFDAYLVEHIASMLAGTG